MVQQPCLEWNLKNEHLVKDYWASQSAGWVTLASQKEFSVLLKSVRKLFTYFIRNANCFPEGVVNYITQKFQSRARVASIFFLTFSPLSVDFPYGSVLTPLLFYLLVTSSTVITVPHNTCLYSQSHT